jgi:hypothetical protein
VGQIEYLIRAAQLGREHLHQLEIGVVRIVDDDDERWPADPYG